VSKSNLRLLLALLLVGAVILPSACSSRLETSTGPPTISSPAVSTVPAPPGFEELTAGGYAHPEIPRITSELLKQMMDETLASGAYTGKGALITWNVFTIVDTLPTTRFDALNRKISRDSYIRASVNIPFTFYWVKDASQDLKPEEVEEYNQEQRLMEEGVNQLPRDKLTIIYDDTGNDEAACLLAQRLLDAGWNIDNVVVLWKGFHYWAYDLCYPVMQGEWDYPGEVLR
jgi:hypothetical protein